MKISLVLVNVSLDNFPTSYNKLSVAFIHTVANIFYDGAKKHQGSDK